mmetsp:Transcript_13647/g.29549  ORF Transcript_13647/g.29549 Transcript_13647/m.29549 type:complete len:338 (+) Transcript_13647:109-1122(+)
MQQSVGKGRTAAAPQQQRMQQPAAPHHAQSSSSQIDYWSMYGQQPQARPPQAFQPHPAHGPPQVHPQHQAHPQHQPHPQMSPVYGHAATGVPHAQTHAQGLSPAMQSQGQNAQNSYSGSGTLSGTRKGEEVRLWENNRERQRYSTMAEMFALFKVAEQLERAWQKSAVTDDDYTREMWKVINQFKATRDSSKDYVPDLMRFAQEYNMDVPAALHRLLVSGVPATVEHGDGSATKAKEKEKTGKLIAQIVAGFISAMDSLRLNFNAVDQIQPVILDLVNTLNRMDGLTNFNGKLKLKEWLAKLNMMRAVDTLSEDDTRQLTHDLETALAEFHTKLDEL